ncbi:hypothetical protein SLEP1_g36932 [Rubroshorea leprosula]|uniref:Uncharacterized protein n=1 Tax=Rubroshorea leprosula TaxID=152421 RepID=A0AAV5KTI6_9ROSI|nr:hypothetical protein SLEP1_g36932 [Rubroshorea leprosula]
MNRECSNDGAARMYLLFDSDEISKLASIQGEEVILSVSDYEVLLLIYLGSYFSLWFW